MVVFKYKLVNKGGELKVMDNLKLGFEVMIIGFTVVFLALFALYLLLLLFNNFFSTKKINNRKETDGKKNNSKEGKSVTMVETTSTNSNREVNTTLPVTNKSTIVKNNTNTLPVYNYSNDSELVAVITAALSVFLSKPTSNFKIEEIRPVQHPSAWTLYGKIRLMELRAGLSMIRRERR